MHGSRLTRWSAATEWPLLIAALLFLVAYATQIMARPSGVVGAVAETAIWVSWGLFVVDYAVRLAIAENRKRWFSSHLLDLAIVALPMLRPLRLMRFLTVLALVQRGAGNVLRGRVVIYTVSAAGLILLVSALAVLDAEEGQGTIDTFGEALWWAFVTMTTVGYGDFTPVTIVGRCVAGGLMLGGIALIGAVTATIASWIVEKVADETTTAEAATAEHIDALRAELAEIKALLSARGESSQT